MIWVDWCLVGLLGLSVLLGLLRGFFREVATLTVWAAAIVVAVLFAEGLATAFERYISVPSVRYATAWLILFLAVLIIGAITTHFIVELIRRSPVSGTDRSLGALFGVLRAVFIGAVLVFFARMTAVREDPWWEQSQLIGPLESAADVIAAWVPPNWLEALQPEAPVPESPPSSRNS